MAVITLTVTDVDLDEGTYKVDFKASENQIDDGIATAAYFTGFYLYTILSGEEFRQGVLQFGETVMESLREQGVEMNTAEPATAYLTLTDDDLMTGRYTPVLTGKGGDETGNSLPTPAQIVGGYMRYLLNDHTFRQQCWAFAEEFATNNGATVTNLANSPVYINDQEDAANAA